MSRDPEADWDAHCAKRERCNGDYVGVCHLCGMEVGDEDGYLYEMVNSLWSYFHTDCYREEYMKPCGCCSDFYDKALIDSQTGECRECQAPLEEHEGIGHREPGDHNERSE